MRASTLDLRALQSLVTVVDTGSVTAAAEQLNYSQSAVSMQLRRLEQQLDCPVLVRDQRRVALTRAGNEVVGYAREMLRLNSELKARLSQRDISGTVRLGMPADFAPYLPATLALFAEQYPRVQLEVRTELSAVLVKRVRAGDIDLAIVTRQPSAPGGTRLRREPLVWVAGRGSTAYQNDPLPLAVYTEGYCEFRASATARLDAVGRDWRAAYESQTFAALTSPVSVGLAVTVAVPSMLENDLEILDPETAGLPELPSVDIALHRSPGRTSIAAQGLCDLITQRLGDGGR